MNIHPLIVHFPIALLSIYALLEIICIDAWYRRVPWQAVKGVLVVFGEIGALFALFTGSIAEDSPLGQSARAIVRVHETFADLTTVIFGVIAAAYLLSWLVESHPALLARIPRTGAVIRSVLAIALFRGVRVTLAVFGLIALFATGTLGGIIVYGPSADVFTQALYSLLFSTGAAVH